MSQRYDLAHAQGLYKNDQKSFEVKKSRQLSDDR
jgi:hypothetical protein